MRGIRFWLIGIVSFILATIGTVFVSGSFLNRLVLDTSCTIFSFNSAFCTPHLGVESDRVMAAISPPQYDLQILKKQDDVRKGRKINFSIADVPGNNPPEAKEDHDCKQNPIVAGVNPLPEHEFFSKPVDPNQGIHTDVYDLETDKNSITGYGKGKDYTSKDNPDNETLDLIKQAHERSKELIDKLKKEKLTENIKLELEDLEKKLASYERAISRIQAYKDYQDSDLKKKLKIGIKPGGELAATMVDLFMDWKTANLLPSSNLEKMQSTLTGVSGNVLRHKQGSQLSMELNKDSSFIYERDNLIKVIQPQLEKQINEGKTQIKDLILKELCVGHKEFDNVHFPIFGGVKYRNHGTPPPVPSPPSQALRYIIGGTQGIAVFITDLEVNQSDYKATLQIVTYDVFGVDVHDIGVLYASSWVSAGEGLIAMWILQHEKTAKPFIQEIIVDVSISGKLEKPPHCNPPIIQSKSENKQDNNQCSPIQAHSTNDPHLVTFDGLKYDLQTVGEFTLIKSNHSDFEVQARQTPWNNSASVSINSAVAVKVGSDRVAIYASGLPDTDTSTPLRVNGKSTTIQGDKLALTGGGEILKQGGTYVVSSPTGEKVLVSSSGSFLNISPIVDNRSGKYNGLLGNVNGKPNDDLQIRGGSNVLEVRSTYGDVNKVLKLVGLRAPGALDRAEQVYFDQLYKQFANSWRVKQEESLFDYSAGKTTKSYVNPGFPDKYLTLNMLSADQIQKAQNACTEAKVTQDLMEGCIFDVGFSGFSEFARATAEINGYIGIVNQLFPSLNIPTPERAVEGVIERVKPRCLPFIGCH